MSRNWKISGLLIAALLLASGVADRPASAQGRKVRKAFFERFLHQPAPDFMLSNLDGEMVKLADQRGKLVLLNFWFTGCPPCRKEIPALSTLYQMHRRKGLLVMGINLDEIYVPQFEGRELKKFMQETPIKYPMLIGDAKVFEDYGRVPAQPTSFLIDTEGKIVRIFWGAFTGRDFDEAIRDHLSARPAPGR